MAKATLHGLYVITDHTLLGDALLEKAQQAIAGGARILQYRDKSADQARREAEATALARLCRQHQVTFLINDDVALAQFCEADGMHLGQQDTDLAEARQQLGPHAIIGITCHADLDAARQAQQQGADYVAFGRFFPSRTKPEAPPATITILVQARAQLHIPIVAIGGVTAANGSQLIEAGADMLAVIHDIFGVADTLQAAQKFARLFD